MPPVARAAEPPAPPPQISDSERALLLDLRSRRTELETREATLSSREAVLSSAEKRLAARVDELTALQGRLEDLEKARKDREQANWSGLVKLYEAMKPRDAAAIFNELDKQVLLQVLDRMKESKAAPVLAAMQPERARMITAMLAQLREAANAAPNAPGQCPEQRREIRNPARPQPSPGPRKGATMTIDKSMNVLIVDDYKTMLRIIRNLLKQIEFDNVEEASDGAEALGKLRAGQFGLVISDWNMAPMTGLQLLQEVRADGRLQTTPFIMITAESKTENVVAAKQAGVSNYIVKPFNAETLKEKIEKVLAHA